MNNKLAKKKVREELRFRKLGRGFIMAEAIEGMPAGRKLTSTFSDQYDRMYVQVDGELEKMSERHAFLAMD